jgi:hypothetical protein
MSDYVKLALYGLSPIQHMFDFEGASLTGGGVHSLVNVAIATLAKKGNN